MTRWMREVIFWIALCGSVIVITVGLIDTSILLVQGEAMIASRRESPQRHLDAIERALRGDE